MTVRKQFRARSYPVKIFSIETYSNAEQIFIRLVSEKARLCRKEIIA